jgi:hypothetical protein
MAHAEHDETLSLFLRHYLSQSGAMNYVDDFLDLIFSSDIIVLLLRLWVFGSDKPAGPDLLGR